MLLTADVGATRIALALMDDPCREREPTTREGYDPESEPFAERLAGAKDETAAIFEEAARDGGGGDGRGN